MAARIGSLYVSLVADMAGFTTDMQRGGNIVKSTTAGMRRDLGLTQRSVEGLSKASKGGGFDTRAILTASRSFETMNSRVGLLRGTLLATTAVFGGLAASLGANILSRYADQFTSLQNSIRPVTKDAADLAAQTQAVADVANRSRSSLSATAVLYSRLFKAAPTQGAEKLLRYTETINKALQTGGATAQEAASAAIQFSQAIQSNRLGGEELRAVLETPLGGALAKGLGVTIGQMRKMAVAGELTADVVLTALDKISDSVDSQFNKSVATLDQSLTVLDNNLSSYVGNTDKAYGITRAMSGGILGLANNLDSLIPALSATVGLLGAGFVGKRIGNAGQSLIGAARTDIQARQQALKDAKEAAAAAAAASTSSRQGLLGAVANTREDQRGFADGKVLKTYQRDLEAVQRLDEERLGLLTQQRVAIEKMGDTGRVVTPAAIKAANKLFEAELQVATALKDQDVLRKNLDKKGPRLNALLAQRAISTGPDSTKLQAINKEIAGVEASMAQAQKQYDEGANKWRASVVELQNQRVKAAGVVSKEVLALLREENSARDALLQNEQKRTAAVNALRQSSAAAAANGSAKTAEALQAQVGMSRAAEGATAAARKGLNEATKNARLTSIAWSGLMRGGSSLIGFLGGPWGIAFAAAAGVLTLMGLEAQKSAVRMDRLQGEMEALGIVTENTGNKIDKTAKSLKDLRADQLRATIGDIKATQSEMFAGSVMGGMGFAPRTLGDVQQENDFRLSLPKGLESDEIRKARTEINALIGRIRTGDATAEELRKTLGEIGAQDLGSEMDDALKVLSEMGFQALGIATYLKQAADSLKAIGDTSTKGDRLAIPAANQSLQEELDRRTKASNDAIDEATRQSNLTDRQKAIEDAAKDLAESIKKASGIVVSAASLMPQATALIDNKENQEAIKGGILKLIRHSEGTADENSRGYNETLGNGRWTGGDVNLVGMTLKEVLALQQKMLTPENQKVYGGGGSSAVGAYQIVGKTLKGLIQELGLTGDELFDPEMQDRLAQQLLRQTKGDPDRLRGTWEGLKAKGYSDDQLSRAYNGDSADIGPMDKEVAARNKDAAAEIVKIEEDKQEAYANTMRRLREQTSELNSETGTIGMNEAAKARQALITETLNDLRAKEVPITDAVKKAVEAEANARYSAVEAQEKQEISNAKLIETMDDIRSTSKDVMGGFIQDLIAGKSATEALGNALMKIGQKLLDSGLDSIIESLFGRAGTSGAKSPVGGLLSGLFGGGGGGGGGLFGGALIPGILHSGGKVGHGMPTRGRRVPSSTFIGAPRFHSGLGSREFAAVLEQGEHVLTARQAGRTANAMAGLSRLPASNRNDPVNIGVTVDDEGALRAYVKRESTRTAQREATSITANHHRQMATNISAMTAEDQARS